ncbi:ABC transporter permease [Verrucomicrobium sp. GAS474]|uniref:ABC transporter permease n=1 Tax=Verrucomicrobium sp. GAS474 TaxID=1882831 RepID=UPI0018D3DCC5|nr:ABC transporter permease [Verrucomicrobium sp. GAS474]
MEQTLTKPRQPEPVRLGPAPTTASRPRRRRKADRWERIASAPGLGFLVPLLVLGIWSLASAREWLPPNILPSPVAVAHSFADLISGGDLLSNLGTSLLRVLKGFLLGGSIGLVLGCAMGFSPVVESWIGPLFRAIAQIPSIALIPLLIQFLGIDEALKLFIMAKSCAIPITFTSSDGIRNIPVQYIEVGKVLRLRRRTILRRVILPGALPSLFTGIRQGLSHVWVSLVAVEILASTEGIGYLMSWGRQIFQLDQVFVCIVVIGLVGFLFDFGLRRAEARLLRWKGEAA